MKRSILTLATVGVLATILSGCAEDNYNAGYTSYDNRNNYNKKMDYVAKEAAYEASTKLSAQDIENINNLK